MKHLKQEDIEKIIDTVGARVLTKHNSLARRTENDLKKYLVKTNLTETDRAKIYAEYLSAVTTNSINNITSFAAEVMRIDLAAQLQEQQLKEMDQDIAVKKAQEAQITKETDIHAYTLSYLKPIEKTTMEHQRDIANEEKLKMQYTYTNILPKTFANLTADEALKSAQKAQVEKDIAVQSYTLTYLKPIEKTTLEHQRDLVQENKDKVNYEYTILMPKQVEQISNAMKEQDYQIQSTRADAYRKYGATLARDNVTYTTTGLMYYQMEEVRKKSMTNGLVDKQIANMTRQTTAFDDNKHIQAVRATKDYFGMLGTGGLVVNSSGQTAFFNGLKALNPNINATGVDFDKK